MRWIDFLAGYTKAGVKLQAQVKEMFQMQANERKAYARERHK